MPQIEAIPFDRAAALEDLSKEALKKRLQRRRILTMKDPNHRQRRLVPITALSLAARTAYFKQQTCSALAPLAPQPQPLPSGNSGPSREPLLPFAPPGETEQALSTAAPPGIPANQRGFVKKWSAIVGDCANGTWKMYRGTVFEGFAIKGSRDFVRALAHQHGISVSNIYSKLKVLREVHRDPAIPPDRERVEFWMRILPQRKTGLSGHSFFHQEENVWMGPKLESFYLTQSRLSVKEVHKLLLAEIEFKQRSAGISHVYQKPTLHQSRTYLSKINRNALILAREGEEAYRNKCAPYISRMPPKESGQVVVTDGKLLDILCRDEAWNTGRFWWTAFADVASWRWLGHAFGPEVTTGTVLEAAAEMLEEECIPGAVHFDQGKQFKGKTFTGGQYKISKAAVYGKTKGLWKSLETELIPAIGRNPKTKIIERMFACVRPFEQAWPTWTGGNIEERPPRLALIEKRIAEFKAGKGPPPPVPLISQVVDALRWWCNQRWNARHRGKGKYQQGNTPDEMWNVKRPEGGHRTLTRAEVDFHTAASHHLKVARGGQVNLTLYGHTLEYDAPELWHEQGKQVEVLRSRRNAEQVTVLDERGVKLCIARLKGQLPWNSEQARDALTVRLKAIRQLERLNKRGLEANRLLSVATDLPADALLGEMAENNLINRRQLFGTSLGTQATPRPRREKTRFADERGAAVIAIDEEESS